MSSVLIAERIENHLCDAIFATQCANDEISEAIAAIDERKLSREQARTLFLLQKAMKQAAELAARLTA